MFLIFSGRCAWTTCSSSVPLLIILYTLDRFSTYSCRHEKLSSIVNAVVLGRACLHGGGGPQIGEVMCGGSPHLSLNVIKLKWEIIWTGGPPKRVILPTWVPPPPCKQALKLGRNCDNSRDKEQLNFYLIRDDSSGTHWRKTAPTFSFVFKDPWHALIGGTVAFDPHLNLLNLCG